jgi:hypothetical protein
MRISEVTNDRLKALWEGGIRLKSAWVEFAKFFDRFAYRALRTYPANDPDVLAPDPRYRELQGWLPKTWEGRQEKLVVATRNERMHLLGEIYAGRLWAIGFRTLADGSDELVRVPREYFFFEEAVGPADIRWDRDEITVGSTNYFDIHVVRAPNDLDSALPHSRRSNPRTKTVRISKKRKKVGGRPKTKPRIIRAFRRLWRTNPKFRAMRVKKMVGEVRVAILGKSARKEDRSGYSFSSMAKAIGHELSEVRNRKIRNKPKKPQTN